MLLLNQGKMKKICYIILFLTIFCYWLFQIFNIRHTWDESYFIKSSLMHYEYLNKKINNKFVIIQAKDYLAFTGEHPSLIKLLYGLPLAILYKLKYYPPFFLQIYRAPAVIFLFLLFYFIIKISRLLDFKEITILFILTFLFFNPRFIVFSAIGTLDFGAITFTVIAIYFFLKDILLTNQKNIYHIKFAIFIGLAGASKITGLFAIAVVFFYLLFFDRRLILKYIFSLIFISSVIIFIFYPALWQLDLQTLRAIHSFFFKHFQNYVYYLGNVYNPQTMNAPFHYILFYFFFGNPEIFLISLGVGFVFLLKPIDNIKHQKFRIFILMFCIVLFYFILKPSAPKYDELKQLLLIYPFLAIIIGFALNKYFISSIKSVFKKIIICIILILIIFPTLTNLKFPTLYYNIFSGGLKYIEYLKNDIDIRGELFNNQIWQILNANIKYTNKTINIRIAGQDPTIFEIYNKFKILKFRVYSEFQLPNSDIVILLNHKSVFTKDDWRLWSETKPDYYEVYNDVILWKLYFINKSLLF